MSETYLRLIPTEPTRVPSVGARERALAILEQVVLYADDIGWRITPDVRLVDCGEDFQYVACPACGTDLGEWWSEAMRLAQEQHFADLRVTLPCCGMHSSLNDLAYSWPMGFARATLAVMNPAIESLPVGTVRRIEQTLGCRVRTIWAHA